MTTTTTKLNEETMDEKTATALRGALEARERAEAELAAAQHELRGAVKVAAMKYRQQEIADTLGISRPRVSQLLKQQEHA